MNIQRWTYIFEFDENIALCGIYIMILIDLHRLKFYRNTENHAVHLKLISGKVIVSIFSFVWHWDVKNKYVTVFTNVSIKFIYD